MKKRYLLTTSILIDVEVDHPDQGPEDDQTFEQASSAFWDAVIRAVAPYPSVKYHGGCTITEILPSSNLHLCARCGREFTYADQENQLPGIPLGWKTERGNICDQCETWKNTPWG